MKDNEIKLAYFDSVEKFIKSINQNGHLVITNPLKDDSKGIDISINKIGMETYHVKVEDIKSGTTIDTYTNELDDSFINRLKNTVSFLREDIGWD